MDLAGIDLYDQDAYVKGSPTGPSRSCAPKRPSTGTTSADGQGFWAVTGYDDVVTVNRDNVTFSSARGGSCSCGARPGGTSSSSGC